MDWADWIDRPHGLDWQYRGSIYGDWAYWHDRGPIYGDWAYGQYGADGHAVDRNGPYWQYGTDRRNGSHRAKGRCRAKRR